MNPLRSASELWKMSGLRRKFAVNGTLSLGPSARILAGGVSYRAGCRLTVGEQSIVNGNIVFERDRAEVIVGKRTWIGNSVLSVASLVTVGDDVLISWGVNISDHGSHAVGWRDRSGDVLDWSEGRKDWTHVPIRSVTICDKAWIGLNSIVMKGLTIGEGAVVGAGSVVTKDVAPWTVVAGNPARVIRTIPDDER